MGKNIIKTIKQLLSLLLILLFTSCASLNGPTKNFKAGVIPKATIPSSNQIKETRKIINKEFKEKQKIKLYTSGNDYNRVNFLVKKLCRAAELGQFSYPVIIADAGKNVNAMVVNGSIMVVYKELLHRVPNNNELVAVIGHEISHILWKHHEDDTTAKRSLGVQLGARLLGSLIGAEAGESAGELAENLTGTLGSGLFVGSYSREMEYEADHTGMMLMAKAGFNPNGAISFWSKANKIFGSNSGGFDFLSTHPAEGKRLQRLKENLPLAMKYYKKSISHH